MSELLLDALMQLLALLTDYNKEQESNLAHTRIKDYLERQYNSDLAEQYLQRYTSYLNSYHGVDFLHKDEQADGKTDSNYNQILDICEKLNHEMEVEPKVLLFVELIEFLNREAEIGASEKLMIDVLAQHLKIDSKDYNLLKTFILGNPVDISDPSFLLLISGDKKHDNQEYKHIYNEKQQVVIWILKINSIDTLIFKYAGGRNLYLNGNKLKQNKIYVFASGSVIKTSIIAPIYYTKVNEVFIERKDKLRIIYRAIDVEHKFNPKLIGVHKFSLIGRGGQLIGILGGSGTGKSTLLNVLNGNLKTSNGMITINGFDIKNEKENLEGVIGYVPQEDLLIEELTVYENLYFNARLCFSELAKNDLSELVNSALEDFDLVEAENLVVGSSLKKTLSGGQRKRLNIALELIRKPRILFVDEPTSGLSSMDSEKVMMLLKRQTLNDKLVIVNIHQPASDIFKLFDKLLILDKGGRVIYNGNPMDAIVYFKKMASYVNPEESECHTCGNVKAEQPLRIVEERKVTYEGKLKRERKITPQKWYEHYRNNFEDKFKWKEQLGGKKEDLPPNLFSIPKRIEQFKIYLFRDALSKLKDKQYLFINLIEGPALAVILGFFTKYIVNAKIGGSYMFSENVNLPSYLFMCVIVALFLGLNISAEEIIKDKKLLKRESFLNLSRFSYLTAKVLVLFCISAIQTFTFVIIGNSILEIQGLNFSYWLILFSVSCFANMLGLNISSGLNSVVSIYISIPLILVPQMLFSGVIVEFDKLHSSISNDEYVPFIGDIMTSRWAFEALVVNEFMNNNYQKNFFDFEKEMSESNYFANLLIPELKMRNNEVQYALTKNDSVKAQMHLNILNNELIVQKSKFNILNLVTLSNYSLPYSQTLNRSFDSLRHDFQKQYVLVSRKKDHKIKQMIDELGSTDNLLKLKQKNHNEILADWALATKELKQIVFNGERYIQKTHPIYKEAENRFGRAHFYAPYKFVGNVKIATPVFNVLVIWLMTFILFITLYFSLLRTMISKIERFRLRKIYSAIQKMST
ncbi:MAG: ATP-binding cassette domain-containing protein [Salinivirgaceae bacterium]|nr:ATP-binding cassette domain-containing protein [Salinivirgaceae bacterium]